MVQWSFERISEGISGTWELEGPHGEVRQVVHVEEKEGFVFIIRPSVNFKVFNFVCGFGPTESPVNTLIRPASTKHPHKSMLFPCYLTPVFCINHTIGS